MCKRSVIDHSLNLYTKLQFNDSFNKVIRIVWVTIYWCHCYKKYYIYLLFWNRIDREIWKRKGDFCQAVGYKTYLLFYHAVTELLTSTDHLSCKIAITIFKRKIIKNPWKLKKNIIIYLPGFELAPICVIREFTTFEKK